jgi:transposase
VIRLPTLNQLDVAMEGSPCKAVRIFLCTAVTDMRCGFDRLGEMVRQSLRQDPLSGNLFVFRNRRGDKLKIFYWDSDGFAQWYKRLEEGTFRFPRLLEGQPSVEVRASELAMLLVGIDLRSIQRVKRFKVAAK